MTVPRMSLVRLLLLATLPVLGAGCSGDPAVPAPAPEETGAVESYALRSDDGVDVVYFEPASPCECMAEVGVAVEQAVRAGFSDELSTGELRFYHVVSDDPANRPTVEMFNAQPFDLFIVESEDGRSTSTPVYEIWNMMGDNDAIAACVTTQVSASLAGQP